MKRQSPAPDQLVEHFFRHEYGNLVAILTRTFGVPRIDLIEDSVSAAMAQAMHTWKQARIPENPSGWIHRVARNRILDALRREKVQEKALALSGRQEDYGSAPEPQLEDPDLPGDSLLQMMFVCCHPSLERKSRIALTLKILCGFGIREIARGLMMTPAAVKKRVQRARESLAESEITMDIPSGPELQGRLSVVHDVLYLMFNEGYSTTHGVEPIRDDVCDHHFRLRHRSTH